MKRQSCISVASGRKKILILILAGAVLLGSPAAFPDERASFSIKDSRGVENIIRLPVRRAVFHINYELIPALEIWDCVVGLGGTASTNDLVLATIPAQPVIPVIGDIDRINIELLIRVKPDVLITWSYNTDELNFIQTKARIPTIAFNPENLSEFYEMLLSLGAMFGKRKNAEQVINEMEKVFRIIEASTAGITRKKKILWLGAKPTVVVGKLDPKNDIIRLAGAENLAAALPATTGEISLEQIVAWEPDAVFISWYAPYSVNDLLAESIWRNIKAVRNRQVFKGPPWATWSPRLALLALWMASRIYPERFGGMDVGALDDDFCRKVFHLPSAQQLRPGG